jgi:hypothetical protein
MSVVTTTMAAIHPHVPAEKPQSGTPDTSATGSAVAAHTSMVAPRNTSVERARRAFADTT